MATLGAEHGVTTIVVGDTRHRGRLPLVMASHVNLYRAVRRKAPSFHDDRIRGTYHCRCLCVWWCYVKGGESFRTFDIRRRAGKNFRGVHINGGFFFDAVRGRIRGRRVLIRAGALYQTLR